MNGDWRAVTLEDVVDVKSGKRIPKGYSLVSEHTDHPYIRIVDMGNRKVCLTPDVQYVPAHVFEKITKYTTNANDVLVSIVGTVGLVSITDASLNGASLTENAVKLVNPRGVDRLFLYYWLSSPIGQQEIKKRIVGSTQPKFPIYNIKQLPLHLPPLPIQRRIADILGALDDKIEYNRRINQTLEAMAQALYKHWFVDFGPFRSGEFVDSELGKIPKGWRVGTIADIAKVTSGKRPLTRLDAGQYRIFGGGGPMGYTDSFLFDARIIITGRVGTIGEVFRIAEPVWPSDNTLVLIPNVKEHYEYLFHALQKVTFSSLNRGSTQALVTQSDIAAQTILLPDEKGIERFHFAAKSFYDQIDSNIKENQTLTRTRDYLLPKLLSGEVEVSSTEKISEMTA